MIGRLEEIGLKSRKSLPNFAGTPCRWGGCAACGEKANGLITNHQDSTLSGLRWLGKSIWGYSTVARCFEPMGKIPKNLLIGSAPCVMLLNDISGFHT